MASAQVTVTYSSSSISNNIDVPPTEAMASTQAPVVNSSSSIRDNKAVPLTEAIPSAQAPVVNSSSSISNMMCLLQKQYLLLKLLLLIHPHLLATT